MVEIPTLSSDELAQSRDKNYNQGGNVVPGAFHLPGKTDENPCGSYLSTPPGDPLNESLQDAAMAIPDADAVSLSSLHTTSTDRDADEETAAEARADLEPGQLDTSGDTRHELDWQHILGLSGKGINAASTASSLGFAAAKHTTTIGFNLAKRITQGIVAIPAIALDGAVLGNTPSMSNYTGERGGPDSRTPTIAEVAHAAVGGMFDVVSNLTLAGIDMGSNITGAGFSAAASGVEGLRRALGSEVLRSLGAFSRLVKREWGSDVGNMPPGGIPAYSVIGITQALTAWVSIQMVSREYYERKMLRNLDLVNLDEIHRDIQAKEKEQQDEKNKNDDHKSLSTGAPSEDIQNSEKPRKKKVRIFEGEVLPGDEGEVIGAEIGEPSASKTVEVNEDVVSQSTTTIDAYIPEIGTAQASSLSTVEAIQGLKRYSRLVLGVYGGAALAWLGSLPPDLMQAAGSSVEQSNAESTLPTPASGNTPTDEPLLGSRPRTRSAAQDDEADFLRAAASLDLDESELMEDEASCTDDSLYLEAKEKAPEPKATMNRSLSGPTGEVLFQAEGDKPIGDSSTPTQGSSTGGQGSTPSAATTSRAWSCFDVLMGQADSEIFHRLGGLEQGAALEGTYAEPEDSQLSERARPLRGKIARPSKPRYYVVTDHTQRKIVLVLRGSLTLGDIAIDLTCESANFQELQEAETTNGNLYPEDSISDTDSESPQGAEDFSSEAMREKSKARAAKERQSAPQARPHERTDQIVHEGMYETAKEIGEVGRPVHRAVKKALKTYPGYDLDITGHSLGAGVAALLAVMWASPDTGCTTLRSGLPSNRRVHAYCFAVPCVMGSKLAKRAETLVTSYCYSYDLVNRLSLGAILDIRNACAWLAYENNQPGTPSSSAGSPSHYGLSRPLRFSNIMQRAFVHQSGQLNAHQQQKTDLEADFLALRRTLEANMCHVELYPPGTIMYSLAKDDLMPHLQESSRSSTNASASLEQTANLYRLRENGDRSEVFGQIIHARGMLSRHMPHLYHAAVEAL